MTSPRSRAVAGIVILALAAGLLVVAPRLAPQPVPGTALSDWPTPPEIGDCLNLPERGTVDVVPCGRPHDAEVTRSWAATDPVLDASPSSWMDGACADAAAGYVGRVAYGVADNAGPGFSWWQPVGLSYQAFEVGAPEPERVGSRGWRACVIRPTMPVRYTGTVGGAAPTDLDQSRVPEAYRTCLDDHGNVASCTIPHPTEVLALGTAIFDWQLVTMEPGLEYSWNGSQPPGWGWESGTDPEDTDPEDTDPEGADSNGGADESGTADSTPLDQMAQAQAEAMQRLLRERAILGNQGALRDAEKTLTAQCLDLAPGMVPALTPAPSTSRVTLGLSDSTAALGSTDQQSGVALMNADNPSAAPAVLAIGEVNGFESVTAACVVTAPAGQQFSRSLLGWTGDTLPLISG